MNKYTLILTSLLAIFSISLVPVRAQDSKENSEYKMALDLYKDGLFDLAKDQLKTFIQKFPNSQQGIEARFYLGSCQLKTKNFEEAKNTFQNFAITYSENPKAPDAWWYVGEAYAAMKNYQEAASAFERVKTFHPKSARASEALLEASKYYQLGGNMENAGIALRAILQEYPNSNEVLRARYAIGKLYTATGDFDRAFSELKRAAEGSIDQELKAKAITAIGVLYGMTGNRDDAEKKLREVIALYAKTNAVFEAYVRLGDIQRQYQNFSDATQNYNNTANNVQADLQIREEAYMGAAECAIAAGDFKGAIKIYQDFFTTFKGKDISANVYIGAARAARKAGEYSTASQYYSNLLADTTNGIDRRALLKDAALNEYDAHNYNGAIQLYQQYISKFPNDAGTPFAFFAIGSIHEKEFKNYSQASSIYSVIIDRFSSSPVADDALFSRARCAQAQNKFDEAVDLYNQIIMQYPASEFMKEAEKESQNISRFEKTNIHESFARIAQALTNIASSNTAGINVLIGEIYLNDVKDFSAASKAFDEAILKGISGNALERAQFGRAICEAMLVRKNQSTTTEAEKLLGEFITKYPNSTLKDEAAYQLFLLRTNGKSGTEIILAANDFLALHPKDHADEVALMSADAKRDAGRSSEAETDYTAMINAKSVFANDALFGRGIARMNLLNYSGATNDLQSYLTNSPNGKNAPNTLLTLAQIAEKQGQYEKAASLYEDVSKRFSYSTEFRQSDLKMIKMLSDGGFNDRAVVRSELFLKKEKENPFASDDLVSEYMFAYAEALAKKKDISKAKKVLQDYQTAFPRGKRIGEVYYALGQIFKDEGKISLATLYFQRSGQQSGNRDASRDAADLLLESKKYDEAISEYKLLAQKTTLPQEKAYYESRIVVAQYRAGNLTAAQTSANDFKTKYPDAKPNFDEFEFERGKYLHRQKQYDKALSLFDDLSDSKTPEIASLAFLWVGKTHESMNQNQKAIDQFNRVIGKYPGSPAALEASLSMGRIAFRAEKWDEAAKNFKAVVDQTNVSQEYMKEALDGLIKCLDQLNIADGAAEMTKRFISLFPNDPTIFRKKVNLGMFYQKLTYWDQAITHYENLLGEAASDDQAEIRYSIGECYFGKGDYTQAIIEFLKVPYLVVRKTEMDWASASFDMAARSYEKLNQYEKAIQMYEQIINRPGTDQIFKDAAEKQIKRLKGLLK